MNCLSFDVGLESTTITHDCCLNCRGSEYYFLSTLSIVHLIRLNVYFDQQHFLLLSISIACANDHDLC